MLALGEERVRDFIRTIGLFNTKAKNVIALSRILVERAWRRGAAQRGRSCEVLPGVGTKTASVVLNVAFGEPTIAVDTHIFRVSNRIPLVVAATTDKVQAGLEAHRAGALPAQRPSLADPVRALHLQGPQARMPALPDRRPVPLSGQDARLPCPTRVHCRDRRPRLRARRAAQPVPPANALCCQPPSGSLRHGRGGFRRTTCLSARPHSQAATPRIPHRSLARSHGPWISSNHGTRP